jgi:anion transporter
MHSIAGRLGTAGALWLAAIGLFVAAALVPLPHDLSRAGALTLAGLLAAVLFWASGIQDAALTGLIVITALATVGVMSFERAVAGFGAEFVWLMAATFIIAAAMEDSGLGRRIAFMILRLAGGRASRVMLAVLAVVLVMAFMVPTAAARTAMLLPICLGIIEATGARAPSNFAKMVLVGVSHAAIMAGVALPTAAGATIYAVAAFGTLINVRWAYHDWLVAFYPIAIVFMLGLWRILLWIFPPEREELVGGATYVREQLNRLGPLKVAEQKTLAVIAGMYCLWLVGPRIGISTAQAGVLGALVLVTPGVGAVRWERGLEAIKWNIVILFAVSLSLANALESSGASRWLATSALGALGSPSPAIAALTVSLFAVVLRVGFVNNLGMIAASLPLIFTLAKAWGLSAQWLGMLLVLTGSPGFLLPTQTPTGMITLGYEFHDGRDYLRSGLPTSLLLIALAMFVAFVYWPLLGYHPQ